MASQRSPYVRRFKDATQVGERQKRTAEYAASEPATQSISISGRGRKYGEEIVAPDWGIETAEAAMMMMMTLSLCAYIRMGF